MAVALVVAGSGAVAGSGVLPVGADPALPTVSIASAVAPEFRVGLFEACSDALGIVQHPGQVTLSRTGDTSNALTLRYALYGFGYLVLFQQSAEFAAGSATVTVEVRIPIEFSNVGAEGATITLYVSASDDYQVGAPSDTTMTIHNLPTGIGCGPPAFTDAAANRAQTVAVGSGLVPVEATPFPDGTVWFDIASGVLPDGIELQLDGTFTGVTERAGFFVVVVRAFTPCFCDGEPNVITRLRIRVVDEIPPTL